MRIAPIAAVALAFSLAGCAFPRPVPVLNLATYAARCEVDGAPAADAQLFATVRLPDCSGPQLKMTDRRSAETLYAARSPDGTVRLYRATDWWAALKGRLGPSHPPLLFFHGYNTDNRAALDDAEAIRIATGSSREVVAFTWPSYASVPKYFWDETNADWAEAGGRELAAALAAAGRLTVVGHSMGNHLALDSIESLPQPFRSDHIAGLIMASPDVDRGVLYRALAQGLGVPVTLYGSTRDQALSGSWRLHGLPRAGDLATWVTGHLPDYTLPDPPGADVVDTSAVTFGVLHHSDYIDTPQGAADFCRVVNGVDPRPWRESVRGHASRRILKKEVGQDPCARTGSDAYAWLQRASPKRSSR